MKIYSGTSTPSDGNGHGTHTMGILVGAGGVGVAPGAQFVTCRGCNDVTCSEAGLKQCGEWVHTIFFLLLAKVFAFTSLIK